jgi:hypothetical protein
MADYPELLGQLYPSDPLGAILNTPKPQPQEPMFRDPQVLAQEAQQKQQMVDQAFPGWLRAMSAVQEHLPALGALPRAGAPGAAQGMARSSRRVHSGNLPSSETLAKLTNPNLTTEEQAMIDSLRVKNREAYVTGAKKGHETRNSNVGTEKVVPPATSIPGDTPSYLEKPMSVQLWSPPNTVESKPLRTEGDIESLRNLNNIARRQAKSEGADITKAKVQPLAQKDRDILETSLGNLGIDMLPRHWYDAQGQKHTRLAVDRLPNGMGGLQEDVENAWQNMKGRFHPDIARTGDPIKDAQGFKNLQDSYNFLNKWMYFHGLKDRPEGMKPISGGSDLPRGSVTPTPEDRSAKEQLMRNFQELKRIRDTLGGDPEIIRQVFTGRQNPIDQHFITGTHSDPSVAETGRMLRSSGYRPYNYPGEVVEPLPGEKSVQLPEIPILNHQFLMSIKGEAWRP